MAAVALTLVVLTACTRPGHTSAAKASPTPTPTPSPESAIAWTDCGGGFQCGSVTVPLDYSNPSADSIKIALIRKPATEPANRIGSLLTNPGGPGASGIDYLRSAARSMSSLNRRFDLIGFDPRGIARSAPVQCMSATERANYDALDPVLDDSQEKQAALQANKDFAAACQRRSAKLLPFVDTVSAARDMDAMRVAVGDAKLSYLGYSYGTFLGLTYAHLFPTKVRALSLDGVVDPNLSANDLLVQQMASFQTNLDAFLTSCRSQTSCTFGRSGNPEVKLKALLQRLDTNPLTVGGRSLTRALALYGVAVTLYDPLAWSYLDQGLTSADQGNGQLLLAFSDLLTGRQADGSYSNETDANWAVNCLDRPVPTDVAAYDQLGPAFARVSWLFGPANQYANVQCAYWPVKATGHAAPASADGAPQILLVGGTNDPATPYQWAVNVHQELANSVLLTRNGYGHVSYDKSSCAQAAEDAYLIDLTLPASGTVCPSN
jgi:pimeloyl-ACP methyl ester carboxylesterase